MQEEQTMILIKNGRVVDAKSKTDEVLDVVIDGGKIKTIGKVEDDGSYEQVIDADGCVVAPGLIDVHVHFRDPGLTYKEDITNSSMCTVFAESEVVSLIAQNKETDDIVHGLNKAVASKTAALAKRVGGEERYMMTGGVSKNKGLVKTLEEKLGTTLVISDKAQLCGALGAALFAMDMVQK